MGGQRRARPKAGSQRFNILGGSFRLGRRFRVRFCGLPGLLFRRKFLLYLERNGVCIDFVGLGSGSDHLARIHAGSARPTTPAFRLS